MGVCSSSGSTSLASAKLILLDGQLQEFSHPVKVSQVLQKLPNCFICNSDEMEFDELVTAVGGEEELQPGQLYFALPLRNLRRPLQAEEIGALAVKASMALMKSGDNGLPAVVEYSGEYQKEKERKPRRKAAAAAAAANGGGGGRRRAQGACFKAKLSAIPE
ncbi:hypothetical protein Scep_000822 [Stephania cephalantha]|uniref:Uncharacterized protein n=1 Tax=Stephania cephalantha TaxID=152367 RepID=A0AAP0L7C2_9MAGN